MENEEGKKTRRNFDCRFFDSIGFRCSCFLPGPDEPEQKTNAKQREKADRTIYGFNSTTKRKTEEKPGKAQ